MRNSIYTIGYEAATMERFLETLRANKIGILIDVRAVPLSRRPGFSKNKLAAHLAEEGIEYVGLKGLGTPPEGRAAARKGQVGKMREIFRAHMKTEYATFDLAEAARIVRSRNACLLCFEHDPETCHRLLVAEALSAETGKPIKHLKASIF